MPVVATLQGDDIFLEALPEPSRGEALALIREHCREIDGFIATSRYYADFMAEYLEGIGMGAAYPVGHSKLTVVGPTVVPFSPRVYSMS